MYIFLYKQDEVFILRVLYTHSITRSIFSTQYSSLSICNTGTRVQKNSELGEYTHSSIFRVSEYDVNNTNKKYVFT